MPESRGVPSRVGREGGSPLPGCGLDDGSTLRWASSGGTRTGAFTLELVDDCFGFSFVNFPREGGRDGSDALLAGGAVAGLVGTPFFSTAEFDCEGLTVEFDDDVDDSRTGGNPSLDES